MARNPIQFQKGLSLIDFLKDFGKIEQCWQALVDARWPDGFICPHCDCRKHSFLHARKLFQCSSCRKQTSVTAGTIFQDRKLPLNKWFLAIYRMTQEKNSVSSLGLMRFLGVAYNTARLVRLKIAQVMSERNEKWQLSNRVELDDAYLGGELNGGKCGRGSENKRPFVAAVETRQGRPIYVQFRRVATFSKDEIEDYAKAALAPGTDVVSDGLNCFPAVKKAGCTHTPIVTRHIPQAHKLPDFKWVNTLIGNLKRSLDGTFHSTGDRHMQRYLAEFEYRHNRRFRLRELIPSFTRIATRNAPRPYRWLVPAETNA